MKTTIIMAAILFSIFSNQTFSQTNNPDGKAPSFHISPILNWGNYDINSNPTELKTKFSFLIMVKYPITDVVTITPFYEQNSFSLSTTQTVNRITTTTDGNISIMKAGITFSFYLQ